MRGTVYKRGKVWWFSVTTGYDGDGKRIREQVGGHRTRKEAESALNDAIHRIERGTYSAATKQTLGAFLVEEWLPAIKNTVRPSTFGSYETVVIKHINPRLGSTKLQSLTVGALNAFYADLLEKGRADGKGGLSPKSVRNVHVTLRKALGDAVKWSVLVRNVAEFADPPRLRQSGDREMRTWTAQELRTYLDHIAQDRLFAVYYLAASTGMRRGEVLGVRWQDLDLDAGTLAVRQTLLTVDYAIQFGTPKTARGRRQIALDKGTLAVLRSWKKRQAEERLAIGAAYIERDENGNKYDLVFTRVEGGPVHPDFVSQTFDRTVAKSGLPRIRLHDLRHTHATLALHAGVHPKVVSERLGHATVSFTLDVYSHAIKGLQEDAAERVAGLIFGDGTGEV